MRRSACALPLRVCEGRAPQSILILAFALLGRTARRAAAAHLNFRTVPRQFTNALPGYRSGVRSQPTFRAIRTRCD
jgi:hypothetical protein